MKLDQSPLKQIEEEFRKTFVTSGDKEEGAKDKLVEKKDFIPKKGKSDFPIIKPSTFFESPHKFHNSESIE